MLHQAQPYAQRRPAVGSPFQGAIPIAARHVEGAYLDAMGARIAHQLSRRIEPHGLAIDERRAKRRGLVMFEPGGGVHEECKARRMRLRKSVFTEPQYLIEYLMCEAFGIPPLTHAVDQLTLERLQAALALPGRHRAAQTVRFARGKTGLDNRQPHDLLLKNRHTHP